MIRKNVKSLKNIKNNLYGVKKDIDSIQIDLKKSKEEFINNVNKRAKIRSIFLAKIKTYSFERIIRIIIAELMGIASSSKDNVVSTIKDSGIIDACTSTDDLIVKNHVNACISTDDLIVKNHVDASTSTYDLIVKNHVNACTSTDDVYTNKNEPCTNENEPCTNENEPCVNGEDDNDSNDKPGNNDNKPDNKDNNDNKPGKNDNKESRQMNLAISLRNAF